MGDAIRRGVRERTAYAQNKGISTVPSRDYASRRMPFIFVSRSTR